VTRYSGPAMYPSSYGAAGWSAPPPHA